VDPLLVTSSTLWLLNFQRVDGAFVENAHYEERPLHLAMRSTDNSTEAVPLTAHVLITLEEVAKMLTVRILILTLLHINGSHYRDQPFDSRLPPASAPQSSSSAVCLPSPLGAMDTKLRRWR